MVVAQTMSWPRRQRQRQGLSNLPLSRQLRRWNNRNRLCQVTRKLFSLLIGCHPSIIFVLARMPFIRHRFFGMNAVFSCSVFLGWIFPGLTDNVNHSLFSHLFLAYQELRCFVVRWLLRLYFTMVSFRRNTGIQESFLFSVIVDASIL